MDPVEAWNWIVGDVDQLIKRDAIPSPRFVGNSNVLVFLRGHAQGVAKWNRALDGLHKDAAVEGYAQVLRLDLEAAEQQVRANRDVLRQLGAELPVLPEGLDLDDGQSDADH